MKVMSEIKNDDNLAPIVLFVYNRPWHTQQTIEALQKNELANESELFIYSDEAKNEDARKSVDEVRNYIDSVDGFKKVTVIKREKNWGLANSIIDGVTKIVNEYGKIIVLEDDLVTSPYFLKFMNEALEFYADEEKVFTVSGYSDIDIPADYLDEVYFAHISTSWGWSTWKREWNSVNWDINSYDKIMDNNDLYIDFIKKVGKPRLQMLKMQKDGKIDSWAVRRLFTQLLQSKMTIFPIFSLVSNIGHDGSGVHCGKDENLNKKYLLTNKEIKIFAKFKINNRINKIIFKKNHITLLQRVINKLKRVIKK